MALILTIPLSTMISNATAKLIQSLKHKKYRQKYDLFVVEGAKSISPILKGNELKIKEIWHIKEVTIDCPTQSPPRYIVDEADLKKVTQLKSPPNAIALVHLPEYVLNEEKWKGRTVYLDDVQDPGNVGAIIRICDWYGIRQLIRSPGSADFYGNKVIQSSMGSIGNIRLHTMRQEDLILLPFQIIATDMSGDSSWRPSKDQDLCLVLGNEGEGISHHIRTMAHEVISIPGASNRSAESLNVAISCGIICDRLFGESLQ